MIIALIKPIHTLLKPRITTYGNIIALEGCIYVVGCFSNKHKALKKLKKEYGKLNPKTRDEYVIKKTGEIINLIRTDYNKVQSNIVSLNW